MARENANTSMHTLVDRVEGLLGGLGRLLLAVMGLVVALQILFRFVPLSFATVWTTEIARYLLVVMTLTGLPYAMRRGNHISIRPLLRMLSDSTQRYLIVLSDVLVIVMCVIVIRSGISVLDRTLIQSLPTVGWLKVGYVMAYLIGVFTLSVLFILENMASTWRDERTEPDVAGVSND